MSIASLQKLEAIARHPTISQGIQTITVYIDTYCGSLAHSIGRFAEFHKTRLIEYQDSMTVDSDMQGECRDAFGFARGDVVDVSHKIDQITVAWTAYIHQMSRFSPTREHIRYQELLERAYNEYKSRWVDQQDMIDSGQFIARVVSVLAVTPSIKKLVITDFEEDAHDDKRSPSFHYQLVHDDMFCRSLYEPQRMSHRRLIDESLGPDAAQLIPNLLAALGPTSASISTLEVKLSALRDYSKLDVASDSSSNISLATRNLKKFSLVFGDASTSHIRREFEVLRDFLAPIINTESLRQLSIDLQLWPDNSALDPSSLPLCDIFDWSDSSALTLSNVSLKNVPISSETLIVLLQCMNHAGSTLRLHKVHLTNACWYDILEVLRHKQPGVSLTSPSGSECEHMTEKEYCAAFGLYCDGSPWSQPPQAVQYIQGDISSNPLLDWAVGLGY